MQRAVAKASGLTADRVTWSYQSVNEPSLNHIVINFGGEKVIGIDRIHTTQDLTRQNGMEIKQEVQGVREVPFNLECFTTATSGESAARRLLELTRSKLRLDSIRYGLRKAGVSPFDPGPVDYVPDVPATKFRGRAVCMIRCYVPVTACFEYVGYIARVVGTIFPQGLIGTPTSYPFDSGAVAGVGQSLVYSGAAVPGTIDGAFVRALATYQSAVGLATVLVFPAGNGTQKFYYAFPSSFGAPVLFKDVSTGFDVPNTRVASAVSVMDSTGALAFYDVWATVDFPLIPLTERVQ